MARKPKTEAEPPPDRPADKARRKGERPTDDEYAERVDYAYALLARRKRPSEIKRRMRAKWPGMPARTIQNYLARAREQIQANAAQGRAVLRADSLALYESGIDDDKVPFRDKVKAQERIDKLLGLEVQLPPLELLCGYLGISLEQLRERLGVDAGGPVPGVAPAAATPADA